MKIISVDDHVHELPDLWTARLPMDTWGDRIPQVRKQPDDSQRWVIDGRVDATQAVAEAGGLLARRFDPPAASAWKDVPPAAWDPRERLKAMDADGIAASVLYPTAAGLGGEQLAAIEEPELQHACVRVYNDWLIETWAKASARFVPQCLVPVTSVDAAVAELKRAVGQGHRGVIVPIEPSQLHSTAPNIYSPEWDAFWSAATTLDIPVCFHSGSAPRTLLDVNPGADAAVISAFNAVARQVSSSGVLPQFLFSGIPERFPDLKVIFADSGAGWASYALEVCDHEWDRKFRQISPVQRKPPPYDMQLPSEMFHRQCYVTAGFEAVGMKVRQFIGVDNILWHSEFPLPMSSYPRSVETITRNFRDVPAEERDKMLYATAAALYKLNL